MGRFMHAGRMTPTQDVLDPDKKKGSQGCPCPATTTDLTCG